MEPVERSLSSKSRNQSGEWLQYRASPQSPQAFGHWIDNFVRFPPGEDLASYQREIGEKLYARRRVSARGPHGLGKTALAALIIIHFACTHPENTKIITTASVWRQLTRYLWPEVRLWYGRVDWSGWASFGGAVPEMLTQSLRIGQTCEAFPVASKDAATIEGAHADYLLYVFDEAKIIPPESWVSAEGAFASGDCYWLSISTPGGTGTTFWKIHARKKGYEEWWPRHVTLEEAIAAGRVSKAWAEARKEQWGEDSPVYQARVLGNFPTQEEDSLYPLTWLEAARELELEPRGDPINGVDVARFGDDDSAMVVRRGPCVLKLAWWHGNDTMQTAGKVKHAGYPAHIDEIGMGSGVVDRLREQGFDAQGIKVSRAPREPERFRKLRDELHWHLRERVKKSYEIVTDKIEDPDESDYYEALDLTRLSEAAYDRLSGELSAMRYSYDSSGRVVVEPKVKMKERLGYSPDVADALMLACAPPPSPIQVVRLGG